MVISQPNRNLVEEVSILTKESEYFDKSFFLKKSCKILKINSFFRNHRFSYIFNIYSIHTRAHARKTCVLKEEDKNLATPITHPAYFTDDTGG